MGARIAGLLIACSPLIVLAFFAVKRIFDIKRLSSEFQKKVIEDDEKQKKQNDLVAKNTALIEEIEKYQGEIKRLQCEIDRQKNVTQHKVEKMETNLEIEQLLNMD
jgi:predicted nuclease with TOPRIM domain